MVLSKDEGKVKKLWTHFLGHEYLSLNSKKLKMFANLEEYALKALCKMCEFHIYQTGATINLYNGGVIFHGALKRKAPEGTEADVASDDEGKKEVEWLPVDHIEFNKEYKNSYVATKDHTVVMHYTESLNLKRQEVFTNQSIMKAQS